jgi:hypothetical protein
MFTVTVTDTAGETSERRYPRKADAIRGAQRKQKRLPDAQVTASGPDGEHVWGFQPEPASEPTVEPAAAEDTSEPELAPIPFVAETLPAAELPTPAEDEDAPAQPKRRKTPRAKVRPFAVELFERGDEVFDIEAQETSNPLRLRLVIVGGSDPLAVGEVLGLIEWRVGVNRWVPSLCIHQGGKPTDSPNPARTGKPVSGRSAAITAVFDLLASKND